MDRPNLTNLEARIDRDRRRAEAAIADVLRPAFARCYTHALSDLRRGREPYEAFRDVLMGNPSLGLPGLPSRLARVLLAADYAGYRRTLLVIPAPLALSAIPQPPLGYRPAVDYRQRAFTAAGQLLTTLTTRVRQGLAVARGGLRSAQDALRGVWSRWGYGGQGNGERAISVAAEALGGEAFQAGYSQGLARSEVRQSISGLAYSATLDASTTTICKVRDGVKLTVDDPWWARNWPLMHFGCRSVVVPIVGPFTPTINPPELPRPTPGFGIRPSYGAFAGVARVA